MPFNPIRKLLTGLVAILAVVAVLRVVAVRWWQLPDDDAYLSASVVPTLAGGDWLLLWRLTSPGRGDLAVCPDPNNPGEVVVGRILAVGGDVIELKDSGDVVVNGQKLSTSANCSRVDFPLLHPRTDQEIHVYCEIESIEDVARYTRGVRPGAGLAPAARPRKVPEGEVFLVSDDRWYPFDSRDFGSLPVEECGERVVLRLVSKAGYFDAERRFTWIH